MQIENDTLLGFSMLYNLQKLVCIIECFYRDFTCLTENKFFKMIFFLRLTIFL